jgi:hypothetical protein
MQVSIVLILRSDVLSTLKANQISLIAASLPSLLTRKKPMTSALILALLGNEAQWNASELP